MGPGIPIGFCDMWHLTFAGSIAGQRYIVMSHSTYQTSRIFCASLWFSSSYFANIQNRWSCQTMKQHLIIKINRSHECRKNGKYNHNKPNHNKTMWFYRAHYCGNYSHGHPLARPRMREDMSFPNSKFDTKQLRRLIEYGSGRVIRKLHYFAMFSIWKHG